MDVYKVRLAAHALFCLRSALGASSAASLHNIFRTNCLELNNGAVGLADNRPLKAVRQKKTCPKTSTRISTKRDSVRRSIDKARNKVTDEGLEMG